MTSLDQARTTAGDSLFYRGRIASDWDFTSPSPNPDTFVLLLWVEYPVDTIDKIEFLIMFVLDTEKCLINMSFIYYNK